MIFQDNVIKESLKNVYFITGTPCGGKTTISRALATRHSFLVYDVDEQFAKHQKLSNATYQPAMNKQFPDADAFFGRSVAEYRQWLLDNTREQLDFVLLDLIRLSQDQIVLCDCHLTLEQAAQLTDASRIAFLIKEPSHIIDDYCNRPDHQDFNHFINSASNPERAKAVCNETLKSLNEKHYHAIKNSEYFWAERTSSSTVEETVCQVEQHFGFSNAAFRMEDVEIKPVERGSALAAQLLAFVEACSWVDAKAHLANMLRDWAFHDWETMFAAVVAGQVVGMVSILKTDYYPLPDIFPWISSVFVSEAYRGHRISEKLIAFANEYAKANGFSRTYIPSTHVGLYEKYGYRYLHDIVNYGNGIDRLYVKELSE